MHIYPAHRAKYKLLTTDFASVGFLHSTIIEYNRRGWTYPAEPPAPGPDGPGGLWVAHTYKQAVSLMVFLYRKHGRLGVIYNCIIGDVLHETARRIKTDRVLILDPATG